MARILTVEVALVLLALYILKRLIFKRTSDPLPPGPKGLPVIGNIYDLPPTGPDGPCEPEFLHWAKHKDLYGPISSVTIQGQTMIIIHDPDLAARLLSDRSNIHSGRPSMKFAFDMVGWIEMVGSRPNDKGLRELRKHITQQVGSNTVLRKFEPMQEAAVGHFLLRTLEDQGKDLVYNIKKEAGELIIKVVYGYNIQPHKNDFLIDLVDKMMQIASIVLVPGAWAVDMFPWLEYWPEWLPGGGFHAAARKYKKALYDTADIPYEYVKRQIKLGRARPSFVSKALEQLQSEKSATATANDEHNIKWAAVGLYAAGADTSVMTMESFFLAMSLFPEVQKKAQEEIDRVVGTGRLPDFGDRAQLPYINAIVTEAQRWHPIVPLGLPHASDAEDTINGYRIPKGSIFLPNVWWFSRDPARYHDPEAFKPERYAAPWNEPNPTDFTFGWGRRICPGRYLAEAALYLSFAQTLAVFDILKPIDANGKEIEPVHTFGPGILSKPGQFKVRVLPRSGKHKDLIQNILVEHPWEEGDAKDIPEAKM